MTELIFYIPQVLKKLAHLEAAIEEALSLKQSIFITGDLGRDAQVLKTCHLPNKPKLSTREGQARLIHDLASIELQAMELAIRTLYEFVDAPVEFRNELAQLAKAEASHLRLCLQTLKNLGFDWGDWPIHTALWQMVSVKDSLLERVFIVHRYLEASGLDAGDSILTRLSGVRDKVCLDCVSLIVGEEVGHVEFGSRWFRKICELENKNSEIEFRRLYDQISLRAPRKEKTSARLRRMAGFSESELSYIEF